MRIFLSWSGARSRAVAELLADWVKCVLQATQPWLSTRDIDRGALWFSEIQDQLKDTSVGIICLTNENKNRPWILFEAGALAKGLSSGRVCTLLVDLRTSDIEDPLAQFNHTSPDRDGMWELVRTLNRRLADPLADRTLEQVFNTYWEQFKSEFDALLEQYPASGNVEPRDEQDLLREILDNTRGLDSRLRSLEAQQSSADIRSATGKMMGIHGVGEVAKSFISVGVATDWAHMMLATGFSREQVRKGLFARFVLSTDEVENIMSSLSE